MADRNANAGKQRRYAYRSTGVSTGMDAKRSQTYAFVNAKPQIGELHATPLFLDAIPEQEPLSVKIHAH